MAACRYVCVGSVVLGSVVGRCSGGRGCGQWGCVRVTSFPPSHNHHPAQHGNSSNCPLQSTPTINHTHSAAYMKEWLEFHHELFIPFDIISHGTVAHCTIAQDQGGGG